jgi:cell division initiation protein
MKITSLDIRKQEFNRSFRGYDMDEVDSFLQVVATQWQELVDDLRRSGEKIQEQQLKLDHYMKVEEALEEALQTARSSARITIENAEKKARNTLEEAENRIVDLQKQADSERLQMKRDTAKYAVRQQEIVAKLRAFLMSEMEILGHFDAQNIRPALTSASSVKEIEMVRDEDVISASAPAALEMEEEAYPESSSAFEEPETEALPGDAEGSKSSWEKLEEEADRSKAVREVPEQDSEPTGYEDEEDWDDEDLEVDEEEDDEDWDDDDDEEEDDAEDWDDEEDDDDEDEDWDLEEEDDLKAASDEADQGPPSWRVTPIYESGDPVDTETPDASEKTEPPTGSVSSRFEGPEMDDETEAEIRKIHQILKDLDEE